MYYLVREPIEEDGFTSESQGFAKDIEFHSELIDGRVNIDGMKNIDIGIGDTFKVSVDPINALRGVKFIV